MNRIYFLPGFLNAPVLVVSLFVGSAYGCW